MLANLIALVALLVAQIPADFHADPTPTPTVLLPSPTAPVPEPVGGQQALDIPALICSYSWPCDEALRVVYGPTPPNPSAPIGCPNGESTGNPLAESAGGHRGLFQLASVHEYRFLRRNWTWADAFDAAKNVAIAYELYVEAGGWSHWSCRP